MTDGRRYLGQRLLKNEQVTSDVAGAIDLVQSLVADAVAQHGTSMTDVVAALRLRLSSLPPQTRQDLQSAMSKLSDAQAHAHPSKRTH